jgi:hypothetical protein
VPDTSGSDRAEDHIDKLRKLPEIEGCDTLEEMLEAVFSDIVSPGICMNDGCDYTVEVEPDQTAAWCRECRSNSAKAAPILAGII